MCLKHDDNDPVDYSIIIIKREEWTSEPVPEDAETLEHPVSDVIFTYTNTKLCKTAKECTKAIKDLAAEYKEKGIYDVPYNFVVAGDGTIFEARGWFRKPEKHPKFSDLHGKSVEVCLFGEPGFQPPMDQLSGSLDIVVRGIQLNYIRKRLTRHSPFYELS